MAKYINCPAGVMINFLRKFIMYIAQQGILVDSEGGIIKKPRGLCLRRFIDMEPQELQEQNFATTNINLQEYLNVIFKRKNIFLLCFILPILVVTIFTFVSKPTYRAITRIQVDSGFRLPLKDVYQDAQTVFVNTQIELLKGNEIKRRAGEGLKPWLKKIPRDYRDPKTKIQSVSGTTIIEVFVDSPYRDYALAYMQARTQAYLDFKKEQKEKSSEFALLSLTTEVKRLNEKLIEAQTKLQNFRESNEGIAIEEYGDFSPRHLVNLATKISDLETQKELLARQTVVLEESNDPSLWVSIVDTMQKGVVTPALNKEEQPQATSVDLNVKLKDGSGGKSTGRNANIGESSSRLNVNVEPLPFVFVLDKGQSKNWEALKTKYDSTRLKLARISDVYRPEHPERIKLEAELEAVVKEMRVEVVSLLATFKAKQKSILLEEETLRANVSKWQKQTVSSSSKIGELEMLKGEVDRLQKLYDVLIKRVNEIEVSSDFGLETVSIVESPRVLSAPIAPRKLRDILMSVIVGLCLGMVAVFSLEYFDDSIKSVDELRKHVGIACLGILHSIEWDNENLPSHRITALQDSETLEAYRSIRTNILLSSPEQREKTLLITSSIPSEGKTTTSVNVSIVLAQAGLKVLLIDSDLRRPTIHKLFAIKNEDGFSSVLLGKKSPEDCIRTTDIEGLDFLPAGIIVPDPPKLIHYAKTKEFLQDMGRRYDKVIIDSAPVLTVTDSVILSELVDGIIFVLQGGATPRTVIVKAKEALLDNSSKIIGAIINNLSLKKAGHYYYGYKYKYRYGYKYGYRKYYDRQDQKQKAKLKEKAEEAIL